VGQHMANDLGLSVDYYVWNNSNNPDVIGEIPGLVNPDDIFIIGGHIDDVQGVPGADDNASGSVAALVAADIMSQYQWGCTLRFGFWTGEEQGLLGSAAYAQHVKSEGQNIVGYLNLDMIAWNTPDSPETIYLGYRSSVPGSHELALLFNDVVGAYNIPLLPTIGTGYDGSSDHTSFLDQGYPAVLGIEGNDDFNPYIPGHACPHRPGLFHRFHQGIYRHVRSHDRLPDPQRDWHPGWACHGC
jgi:Zn-dependent M28 family amino/carboxypeptidase